MARNGVAKGGTYPMNGGRKLNSRLRPQVDEDEHAKRLRRFFG